MKIEEAFGTNLIFFVKSVQHNNRVDFFLEDHFPKIIDGAFKWMLCADEGVLLFVTLSKKIGKSGK